MRKNKKDNKQEVSINSDAEFLAQGIGVPNLGKYFSKDTADNTPQIVLNVSVPTFMYGWSEGTISDQDYDAALSLEASPRPNLLPITPMAWAFQQEYWPILYSLLQSGVGAVRPVEMSDVVRYYSLTSSLIQRICTPLALNYLISEFDWSQLPPYTPAVPPSVWQLAQLFSASDVEVADIWRPLYDRLANKVLPPEFSGHVMSHSQPYMDNIHGHGVRLNVDADAYTVVTGLSLTSYLNSILNDLAYLEEDLAAVHNLLATFLPFRVGPPLMRFRGYSENFENINYNSNLLAYDNFGDTGDPDLNSAMTVGTGTTNGNSVNYYHKGFRPSMSSIIRTPIYDVTYYVTDNTYMNLSAILTWNSFIVDDQLQVILYNGSSSSDYIVKTYRRYVPTRFNYIGDMVVNGGVSKAGFSVSAIQREDIIRMNKMWCRYIMGTEALKRVVKVTGGSSVRAIYKTVAETWAG